EGGDAVIEKITLPGVDDDDNATLNRLLAQPEAKAKRNKLRSAYYDMRRVINLVGSVIPPQYFRLGIVLGWSSKAVDILARRCNLAGFVGPAGDLDWRGWGEGWEGKHLRSGVAQGASASRIHSTAFVINTQGGPKVPAGLIHFRDARSATGEWNTRTGLLDN